MLIQQRFFQIFFVLVFLFTLASCDGKEKHPPGSPGDPTYSHGPDSSQ